MPKEEISCKKKTVRGRVIVALIGVCLIIFAILGFQFVHKTIGIRLAIMTVTRHYSGCSAFAAFQGSYNTYYTYSILLKKYQDQCRMIHQDKDNFQLWDTPLGQYWMPPDPGYNQKYWVPLHLSEMDQKIYTKGNQGISPGDIVIDCGAHVGFFTRAALKAGAGLVVAIEIAPENLVCLRRNLSAEIASGKVIICEKGVWDKDDSMDLYISYNSGGDSLIIHTKDQPKVKVLLTTLDKIVSESRLQRVDLVKMDIEGAERNALKGAAKTLQQFKPKLSISAYHSKDDLDIIPALIRQIKPDYQIDYGPLFLDKWGFVYPQVMYFR